MSWNGLDPESFFERLDAGLLQPGEAMPWAPVVEHVVTATPEGVTFVESLKRHPGQNGQTNPVHIVCRNNHETGLSVALGTRGGDLVLSFRSKDHAVTDRNAGVYELDAFGPKGRGSADSSTGWRLFCPLCDDGLEGAPRTPGWVAEEAVRTLANGLRDYSERRRWPRLRLRWT